VGATVQTETKERHDQVVKPPAVTPPRSTWSEAKRQWRAQAAEQPVQHRRKRRRADWLQPLLDRHLGRSPRAALSGAFLLWTGAVVLTLSLLDVIRL
jgi:hypothetical protein